jgi:hypothetical protein
VHQYAGRLVDGDVVGVREEKGEIECGHCD